MVRDRRMVRIGKFYFGWGYADHPPLEVINSLVRIHLTLGNIMSQIDDLKAQVAANKTVIDSALVLINGIADRITAAGTDQAALKALTDDLKSSDDALAAAVTANTPAATPTPGA